MIEKIIKDINIKNLQSNKLMMVFLLVMLFFVLLTGMYAYSTTLTDKNVPVILAEEEDTQTESEESEEVKEEKDTPEVVENVGAAMKQAGEEAVLSAGQYKVGEDIKPGRYAITTVETGKLSIQDSKGSPLTSELFGMVSGIDKYETTLEEGNVVSISKTKEMKFSPISDEYSGGNLSTGRYKVGVNIPSGQCTLKCASDVEGVVSVYSTSGSLRENYILSADPSNEGSMNEIKLSIAANEIVSISKTPTVSLSV